MTSRIRAENSRALRGVRGIVRQQLAILLERGAAAGGVGDDGVEAAVQQGVDVAPRQPARFLAQAGVHVQRAAAALARRASTTSQPFFCSTRTVASFSRAKETLAMQPARNATR